MPLDGPVIGWRYERPQRGGGGRTGREWSDLGGASLPAAARRDPERQQDQADVEPEALIACVDAIESELVAAGDVARRIDLRDAGQPGTDLLTLVIAVDLLERDHVAAAFLDLARTKRPRTD